MLLPGGADIRGYFVWSLLDNLNGPLVIATGLVLHGFPTSSALSKHRRIGTEN